MPAEQLSVYKTLVIGLGSTGTEILEALADRVEWEVGRLERAPWIEFLALETDAAKENRFKRERPDDFQTLSISASAWRDLLERPELHDPSIALTQWADMDTLAQLPGASVDAGAGHIRMVGRLSLLYPSNYNKVKNAIAQRVSRLRNLTEADARRALNESNAGLEMEARFAVTEKGQSGLRVLVVGSLCGGTCSGTASDMGILLRTILNDDERVLGMFTMPHPDLGIAQQPDAEVWKANTYHALTELNQYHLHNDESRYRSIKYPDKAEGTPLLGKDEMPYDIVYLLRPNSTEPSDLSRLNNAIADRMFLNIFVPETDPMAYMVNAGPVALQQGRAFAFSTFGLSTIEYPMRRILEALKYRSLLRAVDHWKDEPFRGDLEGEMDQLGLTASALSDALLQDPESGSSIQPVLEAKRNEVLRHARAGNLQAARTARDELMGAFASERGQGTRGLVHATIQANRRRAAGMVQERMRGLIEQRLLDYDAGPKNLLDVLAGVEPRLGALRAWEAEEPRATSAQALDQLQDIQDNTLLGLFFLKGKASQELLGTLSRSLGEEMKGRLEQKVTEGLRDGGGATSAASRRNDPGALSLIADDTRLITERLTGLRKRLMNQTDRWRAQRSRLENDSATVNGLSLFEPSPGGSVEKEEDLAVDERQLEAHSVDLIRSWTDLHRGVLPGANDPDWLRMPWSPGQDNFERSQLDTLEQKALEPFESRLKSSGKDIIARLDERRSPSFDPASQAMHASEKARIFLNVNEPLGQLDPMSPLPRRKLLISKRMTPEFERSLQPWSNATPVAKVVEGVDPNRVVMLEEWYRFALRGADDVRDMAFATPTRFNTYFTRKRSDIDWTPVRENEIRDLEQAHRRLVLAALHGGVRLEHGALVIDWPMEPGSSPNPAERERRLPANFAKAARMLAFEARDASRPPRSLNNAASHLQASIETRQRQILGSAPSKEEGRRQYIHWLYEQLKNTSARAVLDWNEQEVQNILKLWLTEDPQLRQALLEVFPVDRTLIDGLYKAAQEPLPKGRRADRDGFYCRVCGGRVGDTHEEVIQNGLLCEFHPEDENHPFGRPYSLFG